MGNICREMDDFDLQVEQRSKYPELVVSSIMAAGLSTLLILCASELIANETIRDLVLLLSLCLVTIFLAAGAVGCYEEAIVDEEVGAPSNRLPPPNHISGLGGAVAIALTSIIAIVFTVGQLAPQPFNIPASAGNATLVILAASFALVFLSSRLSMPQTLDELFEKLRRSTDGVSGLGRVLSHVDAVLAFGIAPLAGLTLASSIARYGALFGQIGFGALVAWFCSAPWGILGAFWVFIVALAVVRRWGWVEHVRAKKLGSDVSLSDRRIAKIVDLRDEAMTSLLLLVLVLPMAMRQIFLFAPATSGFVVQQDAFDNFFAWTGFFGVELLKALPFLDWADIYGAENGARIEAKSGVAMHALFIARMIIDLVFLAALVQWISISVAIEKNKRDFLGRRNDINRLDERIERRHLSRLVRPDGNGGYVALSAIEHYAHYDSLALARLRMHFKTDNRLLAAIEAIGNASGKHVNSPSEQFLEAAFMPQPDPTRLDDILAAIEDEGDFDVDNLLPAREQLNWKGNLETQRMRLVQLLVRHVPPSPERDRQFAEILSGAKQDSLRDVRRLVIDTLVRNAKRNPGALEHLRRAAESDPSRPVREHTRRTLSRFGLSLESEPERKRA